MTKQEFLEALCTALQGVSAEERDKTLSYYNELLDDRIEEGEPEDVAVESLGDVSVIAAELLRDAEILAGGRAPEKKSRKVLVTVLLVLGFPLWGSLLLTGFAMLLVVYILLYLPVFILGVLAVSFFAASLFGLVGTPFLFLNEGFAPALFQGGACVAVLGMSFLSAVGFYSCTKHIVNAGKKLWSAVLGVFAGKKEVRA